MKLMTVAALVAFAAGCAAAFAADKAINQKGRVFSESAVSIKKGDTLTFVNDDNIAHNILSTTSGNEFNLGTQAPGTSTPYTFKASGEVTVLCAIHPRMKLVVNVAD
jgi:plastocyanin